jgi:hypothetical protein
MKVIISGPAAAFDVDEQQITDAALLQKIGGLEYTKEVCATYLDEPLSDIGLEGGGLRLVFDQSSQTLRVFTEYRSPRKLKKSELAALVDYTKGQWSDGIGEGCFDAYQAKTGICVSVYPMPYDDSAVQSTQVDDGTKTQKPSQLLAAAAKGNVMRMRTFMEQGVPFEVLSESLLAAVANDQTDAVLLLIAHGADVNYKTTDGINFMNGINCMQSAATHGNVRVLTALIEAGADVNERDDRGATPVMWAANRGHIDALRLLLERGANINACDAWSCHTALMYTPPERLDIVELLLKHGADPNVRTKDGLTASQEALQQAKWERENTTFTRNKRPELYERKAQLLKKHER